MEVSILKNKGWRTGQGEWRRRRRRRGGGDGARHGGFGMGPFLGHRGGGQGSSLTEPESVKRGFSMNL